MYRILVFIILCGVILASCSNPGVARVNTIPLENASTTIQPTQISPTDSPILIRVNPEVPDGLAESLVFPSGVERSTEPTTSIQFGYQPEKSKVQWTYLLAAPFATITDDLSLVDLKRIWSGENTDWHILAAQSTYLLFSEAWGKPGDQVLIATPGEKIEESLKGMKFTLALLPFEQLSPEKKVISIDGVSPMDFEFDSEKYPLTMYFGFSASGDTLDFLNQTIITTSSNFDHEQLTSVVLTGTTALTRATANRMDIHGSTWPGEDIRSWLKDADITHISNEVSFTPTCPLGKPNSRSMMFCSRPEYMELLDYVGADVIELSGNHLLDWGIKPFSYTLQQIEEHGWRYYAGGKNLDDARKPLLMESKGNKIAFIGCNAAGPESVFASENIPGAAPCDYPYLKSEIEGLKTDGYFVIMTFQHNENNIYEASEILRRDFRKTADFGADIVSGSQAHFPQMMEFYEGSFIHYGLGNLFFDQMDTPVHGTRREFIDRYLIYQGKLISIRLDTAMLEDYARPRPMNAEERADFLRTIFEAAGYQISD